MLGYLFQSQPENAMTELSQSSTLVEITRSQQKAQSSITLTSNPIFDPTMAERRVNKLA